jgi:hypothetical protein
MNEILLIGVFHESQKLPEDGHRCCCWIGCACGGAEHIILFRDTPP